MFRKENRAASDLTSAFQSFTLRELVYRFLTAFMLVSLCSYFLTVPNFTDLSFYHGKSFAAFLGVVLLLTAILFLLRHAKAVRILFLTAASVYFVFTALYVQSYTTALGLCLLCVMAVFYTETADLKFQISTRLLWSISIFCMLFFMLFTAVCTCLHYANYGTPCYDFGLFSQMFYNMKETGRCLTTCERDGLLSHFAVHFSPIYYLILPFYMLIPSPMTLLAAQAVLVGSGMIPLILLCRHYKLSNSATALFAVCFAFYPAFSGGCSYYLHENCFLVPLLLWLLLCLEKGNVPFSILSAVLTLCVKEDAAVYVAVIALYFLISKKQTRLGAGLFLLSVTAFAAVLAYMGHFGEGVMSDSRYGNYIYDDGGLFSVIKSVVLNPLYTVQQICRPEKFLFILQMLVPLCFLPICIIKPAKLILLIPFVLINLMTNYRYQFDIGYQYIFGSGALLLYLAVTNYAELSAQKRHKFLLCAALCALILFSTGEFSRIYYADTFAAEKEQRAILSEALGCIPQDAEVSASTFLIANISDRAEIYELETTKQDSAYIALDLRGGKDVTAPDRYLTDEYETLYWSDGIVAVFKKVK